jgi:hypothetical protein
MIALLIQSLVSLQNEIFVQPNIAQSLSNKSIHHWNRCNEDPFRAGHLPLFVPRAFLWLEQGVAQGFPTVVTSASMVLVCPPGSLPWCLSNQHSISNKLKLYHKDCFIVQERWARALVMLPNGP